MTMNNWISVEERLPPVEKPFLGFCQGVQAVCIIEDGDCVVQASIIRVTIGTITHWMDLPSSPETQKLADRNNELNNFYGFAQL